MENVLVHMLAVELDCYHHLTAVGFGRYLYLAESRNDCNVSLMPSRVASLSSHNPKNGKNLSY